MKLGVFLFATDYAMPLDELAPEIESRGFESLFVPEHTHIPASRTSPYPGGGELPKEYSHTVDPFVGLAAAAATTTTLRLGTGICLIIERDPIVLAKEVASLDLISHGRFELGLGGGWNREEMENHGADYETRFRLLEEQAKAMQQIWTEDEAEYHGEFVDFDPIWSWPKPTQKPHPPILLGGETTYTLRRVVDFCDGWLPRGRDPQRVLEGLAELGEIAREAGRDPATISTSVFAAPPEPDALARFEAAGAERALLWLPADGREDLLPRLDRYAKLLA
ncbi:MAG: LLM class F420-dependent oxidoreductase [Acidobacteriota bacterium]|nr:LLM class F420-dependent oxidoreductase [Acidobacteriota bacterium]